MAGPRASSRPEFGFARVEVGGYERFLSREVANASGVWGKMCLLASDMKGRESRDDTLVIRVLAPSKRPGGSLLGSGRATCLSPTLGHPFLLHLCIGASQ